MSLLVCNKCMQVEPRIQIKKTKEAHKIGFFVFNFFLSFLVPPDLT